MSRCTHVSEHKFSCSCAKHAMRQHSAHLGWLLKQGCVERDARGIRIVVSGMQGSLSWCKLTVADVFRAINRAYKRRAKICWQPRNKSLVMILCQDCFSIRATMWKVFRTSTKSIGALLRQPQISANYPMAVLSHELVKICSTTVLWRMRSILSS